MFAHLDKQFILVLQEFAWGENSFFLSFLFRKLLLSNDNTGRTLRREINVIERRIVLSTLTDEMFF